MSCENAPLAGWRDHLIPLLPGVAEGFLFGQLKRVIDDFCRESTCWRGMVTGYSVVENERQVYLNPIDNRRTIVGINSVFYSGRPLPDAAHWLDNTSVDRPLAWTASGDDPSIIEWRELPSKTAESVISAQVYYTPVNASNWLPEILTGQYFQAVLDGALAWMFQQPNKPYSDAQSAAYYLRRYRNKRTEARDQAQRGNTPRAQNWQFPFFAGQKGATS